MLKSSKNQLSNKSDIQSTLTQTVCEKTPTIRFINNIDKMRNPHTRDCVSLNEKYGIIEDYSEYQEQRDLENYKIFINSSAYDDINKNEYPMAKKLTLSHLRKISSWHDD